MPELSRERPILFSGPMVCAERAGTKTQTRRLRGLAKINEAPDSWNLLAVRDGLAQFYSDARDEHDFVRCPYGAPGDRLYVRETWRTHERAEDLVDGILFRADDAFVPIANTSAAAERWIVAHDNGRHGEKWRPSILMPRWASRELLDVLEVRVERVQEISEADILAEGVTVPIVAEMTGTPWSDIPDLFTAWRLGWTHINGAESWEANPYVWAIGFRRVEEASGRG